MGIRDRLKRRLGRNAAPPDARSAPKPAAQPPPEPAGRRNHLLRAELTAPKPTAETPSAEAAPPITEPPPAEAKAPRAEVKAPPAEAKAPPAEAKAPTSEPAPVADEVPDAEIERYTVRVLSPDGDPELVFTMRDGEFVCDGADRSGLEIPSSCRSGGCLVCCGKLLEGEVEMGEQYVLEEEDVDAGFRLLCCTKLRSDAVFISHQEQEVGG